MYTLLLFLFCSSLQAAVQSFYLQPESLFPSGTWPQEELEKTIFDQRQETWFSVIRNNKKMWIPGSEVLLAQDFMKDAILLKASSTYRYPKVDSAQTGIASKGSQWLIHRFVNNFVYAENKKTKKKYWIQKWHFQSLDSDKGYLLTKKPTALFWKRDLQKPSPIILDSMQRLSYNRIVGKWAEVYYRGEKLYIPSNVVLSRFDIATEFLWQNTWYPIHARKNWSAKSGSQWIDFSQMTALRSRSKIFLTYKDLSSLFKTSKKNMQALSYLHPAKLYPWQDRKEKLWFQSKIRGHGWIWWSKENPESEEVESFSTKQILARPIYDMASDPQSDYKILSANGVFHSVKEGLWFRIDSFSDENYPVHIAPNGDIFVGEFRSRDGGKNFQSYVQWSKVFALYPDAKKMKLTGIKIKDQKGKQILLQLQTAGKKFYVESKDSGINWKRSVASSYSVF